MRGDRAGGTSGDLVSVPRGQCPVCRYSYRLRADGAMQRHHVYSGTTKYLCEGSGGVPVPFDPETCGGCLEYRFMTPGLTEACYSVGIENGKDGAVLLHEVLEAYHRSGHREAA